ncbi:PD40 domain-containing protein [Candidatus Fermentibacteria bacterium]|nr:PD40 domain-containing protein [Candidatus Fermentibacteria bacterium]
MSFRLLVAVTLAAVTGTASADPGYLRYPDVHGDTIVFTAEGDLWLTKTDGTGVRRMTSHPGDEVKPQFSPDGTLIAFSGDYDGNRDVFIMPTSGGEPRRLTWHPDADVPVGWTPDGEWILFTSSRESPHWESELFVISREGGDPRKISMGPVLSLDIDPGSGRWAFTRLGGGGTWKRYRGGTAPDIWVGHPDSADYRSVTDFDGLDTSPMWYGGRIYFLSDRGGTANIWSMLPDGSDQTQHTRFTGWDARWPSMGPEGRISFVLEGDVHLFDAATEAERAVPIDLPSERILTRTRYPDAGQYVTEFALSPKGDRLAVVSRGEVFSVPVKEGVTLPITRGSGAREHKVSFSACGEKVVFVTDESGEEAIVVADAWGRGVSRRVSSIDDASWHFPPLWSPDGKRLAYGDHTHRLYVIEVERATRREVDYSRQSEISDYAWSPDGRWLAYAKRNDFDWGSIFIYDTKEETARQVTEWSTNDYAPAWDPKGRYLYFLSDRTIDPLIGEFDFETVVVKPTKPYLLLLRPDVKNPMAATAGIPGFSGDEEDSAEAGAGKEGADKAKKGNGTSDRKSPGESIPPVVIEFEGLASRLVELPVQAGNSGGMVATEEKVFYLSWPVRGIAGDDEDRGPEATLMVFDVKEKKAEPFVTGVSAYDVAASGQKLAFMKSKGEIYVVSTGSPPKDDLGKAKVALDGMVVELDPREEWRQIYFEGWRHMRDFYWDESMHGVDWLAVRDQYATLLPRVATREDLRDLTAEVIGELVTSHTYVWGGDQGRTVPRYSTGLLGARVVPEAGAFRVERIYRGDPPDRVRSPLEEPGAGVRVGEYILMVNHESFRPGASFEASLGNLAERPVVLTVNTRPDTAGARDVVVTPLRNEHRLLYADWVRLNREYVAEKTGGRIGYVHIPDMGGRGLAAFHTWFFPQLDKEGMIVDVRYNGGGFVSQLILARLQRHIISWDRSRTGAVWPYPHRVLNGPFVVLTNENAGSDGDIFPEAVQLLGLAPIIGKRSWGGVIGIRGGKPMVDGGGLTQPEFAWWDSRRGWGLENRGVEPDIEVDNLPQDIARGMDAQLDRGISEVMRLRQERPPVTPVFGPAPDRTREAYGEELIP